MMEKFCVDVSGIIDSSHQWLVTETEVNKFQVIFAAVKENQQDMLPDKHATVDSAQNSVNLVDLKVTSINCCNMYQAKTKEFATNFALIFFQNLNINF